MGDLDNDGRVDAVLTSHNEVPVYFHNRTESPGRALRDLSTARHQVQPRRGRRIRDDHRGRAQASRSAIRRRQLPIRRRSQAPFRTGPGDPDRSRRNSLAAGTGRPFRGCCNRQLSTSWSKAPNARSHPGKASVSGDCGARETVNLLLAMTVYDGRTQSFGSHVVRRRFLGARKRPYLRKKTLKGEVGSCDTNEKSALIIGW